MKKYATLGYFVSQLSSLEYEIDDFIFNAAKKHPRICWDSSKSYPVKPVDKIDFVVDLLCQMPILRQCGDADGIFSINHFAYGLEEIFAFRNVLVHGKIVLIDENDKGTIFEVIKYSRVNGKKQTFHKEKYQYSIGYLDYLLGEIKYHSATFNRLLKLLDGTDFKARQDEILRNRAFVREISTTLSANDSQFHIPDWLMRL